ncbi:hypothetical protein A1354_00560 [Pseudomonas asplenii]|nr:hypothetical protein A1354_00560 [Pseudomonas asplenii]
MRVKIWAIAKNGIECSCAFVITVNHAVIVSGTVEWAFIQAWVAFDRWRGMGAARVKQSCRYQQQKQRPSAIQGVSIVGFDVIHNMPSLGGARTGLEWK